MKIVRNLKINKNVSSSLLRLFTFVLLSLLINLFSADLINAAEYRFSPATANWVQGCEYNANIIIDTQGQSSNAADVLILYDPTKVEILDSDSTEAGIQIQKGSMYQAYFGNIVDSGAGEIRLTGASFSTSFTGVGTFATINFRSLAGATSADFTIYTTGFGPYVSLDSNIADTLTSNDLLTGVVNGSYSFTTGFCFADTQPPVITFLTPTNNQTGVPANANLSIRITDNQSGTDIQTVQVVVNGVTQTHLSSGFTYTGNMMLYNLLNTPANLLNTTTSNVVLVRATDFAGNVRTSSITFNIPPAPPPPPGDNESPIITFVNPVDKGTLPLDANLTFQVADTGDGININSLSVILNGVSYPASAIGITYSGTDALYNVTLNPTVNLPDATSYFVVYVEDKAGNGLVKSINFNIKEVIITPPIDEPPLVCPVTPENQTQVVTQVVNQVITQTGQPFVIALNPIFENTDKNLLETVSAATPFLSALGGILLFGTQLWQIPFLLFQWLLALLNWLGLRTRGRPYGYVYDANTKEPLSLAIVRFFDTTGKLVHTDVTDVYGVFSARINRGTYYISVTRPEYKFPSIIVPGQIDYPYEGIYHGERFTVNDDEDDVLFSIPMDPMHAGNAVKRVDSFKTFLATIFKYLTPIVMALGVILAAYLFFKYPSVLNFIVLILYIPTIYMYIKSYKNNNIVYGTVKTMDGKLIKNLEIGLINSEYDKVVGKRITDENGLYRFVVQPGKYKLKVLNQEFEFAKKPKSYDYDSVSDKNEPIIIAQNLEVARKVL